MEADADSFVVGADYGFEQTVFGSGHHTVAAFLPYSWLSACGDSAALGGLKIENSVCGLGDLTVVPVMRTWQADYRRYDFLMQVYAPATTFG
jgi:hypothetical protein